MKKKHEAIDFPIGKVKWNIKVKKSKITPLPKWSQNLVHSMFG